VLQVNVSYALDMPTHEDAWEASARAARHDKERAKTARRKEILAGKAATMLAQNAKWTAKAAVDTAEEVLGLLDERYPTE
jgi:hypothetical protein